MRIHKLHFYSIKFMLQRLHLINVIITNITPDVGQIMWLGVKMDTGRCFPGYSRNYAMPV